MHKFLVEMCGSCLKQDVPLFEAIKDEGSNKEVKNSTIIQDLFRKAIIEEYNWKLCEDCKILLKGAVILENCLLSSKSIYNNYMRMLDLNNHRSSKALSNLTVEIQDIKVTTEEKESVNIINVDNLDGDGIDTKCKIEIDETNNENMLCDFHSVKETTVNIKTEIDNEIVMDSTKKNMAVEQLSNAALLQSSSKHLQANVGTVINVHEVCNNDNETRETNLNSENNFIECIVCNRKFTTRQSLAKHLRAHRYVKSYQCNFCAKLFSYKSCYDIHRQIHTGDKPYKCDLCKKAFSRKAHYNEHRRIHTGEKPYKCDLCFKAFSQQSNYEAHRRIHTGEKPYKCDLCAKAFSNKSAYNRHRRIHTGEKPYKCDLCAKAFSDRSAYNKHRRIHTGEKPYKCDLCAKAFSNKFAYNRHRRIHTGKKPYKCNLCAKAFSDKSTYNKHRRIHTGEKPYKSNLCKKAFSQKEHCNRHRRIHTCEKTL